MGRIRRRFEQVKGDSGRLNQKAATAILAQSLLQSACSKRCFHKSEAKKHLTTLLRPAHKRELYDWALLLKSRGWGGGANTL